MRETVVPSPNAVRTNRQVKAYRFFRSFWQFRHLTFMIVPAALVLVLNNYLPMFGLFIAFKKINYVDGIWHSPWIGFDNFTFLFNNGSLWRIVRNTVAYSMTFMILNLVLSVAIAVAINELRSRLAVKSYQSFLIMPHFLSMVVISYLVYAFLHPTNGFINASILEPLGKAPVSWYMAKEYWPYILTVVNAWKGIGIGAVIYIAAIAGIDPEYYEAAVIDGASKWKQIVHITLPAIMPIVIIMTILNMGHVFNSDFGLFYQVPMDSGMLYPVTDTVDTYVYRVLMQLNDIGMSSAAAMVQSVLGFIMVFITNGAVRKINSDQALF
ncbi:ABC transporter permease subunit [Paenibacillus sp. HWE-109]|uniref:ABC transporter permease n=1 Tax=Paenibacillus sp. HWE-109 TaxID=1306526 RepID=UPI001EDEFAB9|nr:ABC transporter permease subunit [Paenibacillus sp. HWE-109]UKS29304.1 ABC transporter permease subunit [Paenibacillus sp. HWE-109]